MPAPPDPAQESPAAVDEEMSSPGLIQQNYYFPIFIPSQLMLLLLEKDLVNLFFHKM